MSLHEKLVMALVDIRERGLTPLSIYLSRDDLREIENRDEGHSRLSGDGRFEDLPILEASGTSYVRHESGSHFLHPAYHPVLRTYWTA